MPPAQSVGFKPSKRQLNGWRVRSWHDDLLALSCVAVGGSRLGYYKPIHWTAPSWQLEKFLCNEPHLAGFELTGSAEVLNSTLRIVERRLLRFAVTFSHWRMGFFYVVFSFPICWWWYLSCGTWCQYWRGGFRCIFMRCCIPWYGVEVSVHRYGEGVLKKC